MALIIPGEMPKNCFQCRTTFIALKMGCRLDTGMSFDDMMASRHSSCPIIGEIADIALCEFLADKLIPPTTPEELYLKLFSKKAET